MSDENEDEDDWYDENGLFINTGPSQEEIEKKLDSVGITLECRSPLEIRDEKHEAFASGYFAERIIEAVMQGEYDDDDRD